MSTTYSKTRRLKIAKAFKVASKYLATCNTEARNECRKYFNVCGCIGAARRNREIDDLTSANAQAIVMARLNDEVYYGDWVVNKVGRKAYINDQDNHDGRKTQDARRRWLESLHKEFSK